MSTFPEHSLERPLEPLRREDFEIMAPAGSREALMAAVRAGADSVYFGVGELNMRAHSANDFTVEDLPELAQTLHDAGVKAYLTVNTVLYDEDLPAMRRLIAAAKAAQVDAVIVSDPAAMIEAGKVGIPAHLSTQLNVGNVDTLKFYAQFADVAVLARELRLDQVRGIYEAIHREGIVGPSGKPIRIEMFCHGALCMSVSGRCFMSLHTRGKSANRGACLQNCRRAYIVKDKERDIELEVDNEYIMSPKDLKTIGFMDRMVESGVRVFKIEGRARSPEYVLETVKSYAEALEAIIEGNFTDDTRTQWDERLAKVFNRGFWDGYYLGDTIGNLVKGYGSEATEKKVFLGTVISWYAKPQIAYIKVQAGELKVGDTLSVNGPTTGAYLLSVTELRDDEGNPIETAAKGQNVTFPALDKIRTNDKVYKLVQRNGPKLTHRA